MDTVPPGSWEERQLALLVASVRDYAIFMLDPGGHIRSWNIGARHLKGYEAEEIIGQHFSIFYTEPDRVRDHPANELEIATREGRYEEEGWRVRKDGSLFWASVTITAVRDETGELTGFAKVTRDLTERRAAEQALRQAVEDLRSANEELDRFASVAAHDMTDPLRTITGFAEILEQKNPTPEQVKEYAGHIYATSMRLSGMLEGLLAYARAAKSEEAAVPVDLRDAAKRVINDLAVTITARGAKVALDIPEDVEVLAQPNDVELVLQNLISNAVKFSHPECPEVTLRLRSEPRGDIHCVEVIDNGLGIAQADRERIFRAFERAHAVERAGYGLGLAICRRLLDRHGGEIGLNSEPGEGSCFWFSLPRA